MLRHSSLHAHSAGGSYRASRDSQSTGNVERVFTRRHSGTLSVRPDDLKYEWNAEQEKQVRVWGEMALIYHIMHNKTARYYDRYYKYFNTISTVLMGVVSIIEFVTITQSFFWIKVISGFLSGASFIIMRIQNSHKYHEKVRRHNWAMAEYDSLYMEIVEQLGYNRSRRSNVRAMIRMIKKTLKTLKRVAPDIPEYIQDKYIQDIDHALKHSPIHITRSVSEEEDDDAKDINTKQPSEENTSHYTITVTDYDDFKAQENEESETGVGKENREGENDTHDDSDDDIDYTFINIRKKLNQEKNRKRDNIYMNSLHKTDLNES